MKCSVFIATSADGYIATADGGVDWLDTSGQTDIDLGADADMGFRAFFSTIDCMIMGRACMETLAGFNLTPEQWPYGDTRIVVLSRSVSEVPASLRGRVELHAGDIASLIADLEAAGHGHAYVDGGRVITSFLRERRINDLTITVAPVLLGSGIPLIGDLAEQVHLMNARAQAFANGFAQVRYDVDYR